MTTGKTIAFNIWNFVSKVMSLLFNMLSRFVIAFLPWGKLFFQGPSAMSGSNCCFLTCTQVSQETGEMVWYPYLFKNFPQFVVIHSVKAFSVDNEAEVEVFLEYCFFYDLIDVCNLISGSSAFLNQGWTFGSSQFMYCWSLTWRILSITLLSCEMSSIVW